MAHKKDQVNVSQVTVETASQSKALVYDAIITMIDDRYLYLKTPERKEIYIPWPQIKQIQVTHPPEPLSKDDADDRFDVYTVTLQTTYNPTAQVYEVTTYYSEKHSFYLGTTAGVEINTPWNMIVQVDIVLLRETTRRELRATR